MTSFLETLPSYKCIGNEDSKIYAGGWGGGGLRGMGVWGEGGKNKYLIELAKEIWKSPWDHDYSRLSSKPHESAGRLAVKNLKGPFRVKTPSRNISEFVR